MRYKRKAVRSLHFDGTTLVIDIQGESFSYARIVFEEPVWFRVLDERDLCEFWNTYSEPNGWFWQVADFWGRIRLVSLVYDRLSELAAGFHDRKATELYLEEARLDQQKDDPDKRQVFPK